MRIASRGEGKGDGKSALEHEPELFVRESEGMGEIVRREEDAEPELLAAAERRQANDIGAEKGGGCGER